MLAPGQELDFSAWGACLNSDIVSCVSLGSFVLLFLSVLSLARGKVSEMGESMPFSFEGRARRRDYWLRHIGLSLILGIICCCIMFSRGPSVGEPLGLSLFTWTRDLLVSTIVCGVIYIFLMLPVCVRRLHDVGMSGWWLVLLWGGYWIPGVNIIAGIASFVILGCLDGTVGPNRFGDDPKGRQPWGANLSVPVVPVAPPAEQPAARSPESRLAKVRELYEKGLLTEEEYKAQRAAIIAEI